MIKKMKDPVSALTHMSFSVFSIPLIIIMIIMNIGKPVSHMISYIIFGVSLFLLYTASTIYHALNVPKKYDTMLRKIDHMMIFILIAGTYTPICLLVLPKVWSITILSIVWSMALLGILFKFFFINAPRWFATAIYVVMGWVVVVAFYPLVQSVSLVGMIFLGLGGLIYTAGAVIYALKRPKLNFKYFGFHEIFHLFIMGGSLMHIILIVFFL